MHLNKKDIEHHTHQETRRIQQKSILISSFDSTQDSEKVELSPITDTVDPTSTITESLARFQEFTTSSNRFDYSNLDLPSLNLWLGELCLSAAKMLACYVSRLNDHAPFQSFNDTLDAPIVTQRDQPTIAHFPPNTNLRMGWADACSLGRLASQSLLSFDTRKRHIVLGNLPHRNLRQQDCSSMTETSHNYNMLHAPLFAHWHRKRIHFTRNGGFLQW